jgi:tetratricopeptide (TPR) repeat protein
MTPRRWTIVAGILCAMTAASLSSFLVSKSLPPEPDVPFLDGLGVYSRKVTTSSSLAQKYFDQGLMLLYAYNEQEAVRSFQAAVSADPKCAMCYWGIAMGNRVTDSDPLIRLRLGPEGWKAARAAERLLDNATPVERALIGAISAQYGTLQPIDEKPVDEAYASAMRSAWMSCPDDPDVGALYAQASAHLLNDVLWKSDGKPTTGSERILDTLDAVLAKHPNHMFALHLYIHYMEDSKQPERAEFAAKRLREIAPSGLGHLLHMPTHIDIHFGRWQEALVSSEKAVAADKAFLQSMTPSRRTRYLMAHSKHMMAYAAAMLGRSQIATQSADDILSAFPQDFISKTGPFIEFYFVMPYELYLRFGRWDEMLAQPPPDTQFPFATAMWHYARGVAYAAKHQVDKARFEEKELAAARGGVPYSTSYHKSRAIDVLDISASILNGEILYRERRVEEAVSQLQRAVAREDALPKTEPPDLFQSARQTLGAVLMDAGRYAQAEIVYREDLKRSPENGWSLFGLSRSLRRQEKRTEAASVAARFDRIWQHADIKLTASCLCLPQND